VIVGQRSEYYARTNEALTHSVCKDFVLDDRRVVVDKAVLDGHRWNLGDQDSPHRVGL
jgi:hypothetical protein